MKVPTIVGELTRFLFARKLDRKTGAAVRDGLLEFSGIVRRQKNPIVDPGEGFQNRLVKNVVEEMGAEMHTTTPGHARSHGIIERVHSTLTEHMRLLAEDRGVKGTEAIARVVLACNEAVHSVTGKTPAELMRAWKLPDPNLDINEELKGIYDRIKQKDKRLLMTRLSTGGLGKYNWEVDIQFKIR
ncbi:hypothetical protein AAG570_007633 [Ranatra chinensis]|uniref:Integrase catalytic domain-containing protein n=1 Tax=Ranatra chinensis TaxID=642074 RepID=A0ABD0YFX0_9HEMI